MTPEHSIFLPHCIPQSHHSSPGNPSYLIFPPLGQSSCFLRFFQELHHVWLSVFSTRSPWNALSLLESLPLCEAVIFLAFWRTEKRVISKTLEISICSFWGTDNMFLSSKPSHDWWSCKTGVFLYSFSSSPHIHQYMCCIRWQHAQKNWFLKVLSRT